MCNYSAHFLTIFGRSIRVIWREEGGGRRKEGEGRRREEEGEGGGARGKEKKINMI